MARLPSAPETQSQPLTFDSFDFAARSARADAERFGKMLGRLDVLMIPIVLFIAFMMASFTARNDDLWQHLAFGRLVATGGYHWGIDPFSFATTGYWANHAWLFDTVLYKLYDGLGENGAAAAVVFKATLVALMALMIVLASRPPKSERIAPGTKADPSAWFANILTVVGLVAIGPRMLLQPIVVSFLFTGVTFWLLNKDRNNPSIARTALPLGLLFALWVNCDAWFILGPILVALTLVGESIQSLMPFATDTKPKPGRLKELVAALAIGLVACLISPNHIHVFTVPSDVADLILAPSFVKDPLFKLQFSPVYSEAYYSEIVAGRNYAGICAAILFIAGLLSFALNIVRLRWSFLWTWVAFAAMAIFHWRLIPFFAIVAVPIAILNFQAWLARLPHRFGTKEPASLPDLNRASIDQPVVETKAAFGSNSITAIEPIVPISPTTPPETKTLPNPMPKDGDGIVITASGMAAFGVLMARLLTIAFGGVVIAFAYPGWLHATPKNPMADRHVVWAVEPNEAYREMAEQFAAWRSTRMLPKEARLFCFNNDNNNHAANYLAWYAPEERNFFDSRYPVTAGLSKEYMQVQKGLANAARQGSDSDDWAEIFRDRKITHVVLSRASQADMLPLMLWMLQDESQWTLWYYNGQTAVFAWRPVGDSPLPAPATVDPVREAFGAGAKRLPNPTGNYATFPDSFDDLPRKRELLDRYLYPPPIPPHEGDVVNRYEILKLAATEAVQKHYSDAKTRTVQLAFAVTSGVGLAQTSSERSAQDNLTALWFNPMSETLRNQLLAKEIAPNEAAALSDSLLAVRETWRTLLAKPDQTYPYLELAKIYDQLPAANSELRSLQKNRLMYQGLARLTDEEVDYWNLQRDLKTRMTETYFELFRKSYSETRGKFFDGDPQRPFVDLGEECLRQCLKTFKKHPPREIQADKVDQMEERLQNELEKIQKGLPSLRDRFENESRNRSMVDQAKIAIAYGLAREALRALEPKEGDAPLDIESGNILIYLYITLGQGEKALDLIRSGMESSRLPERDPRREYQRQQRLRQFQQNKIRALIVAGEFAKAGEELDAAFPNFLQMRDSDQTRVFLAFAVGGLLQCDPTGVKPWGRDFAIVESPTQNSLYGLSNMMFRVTEHHAMRGMLALEEGDCRTALKHLKEAVQPTGSPPIPFQGRQWALRYVEILKTQFPGE